MSAFTLLLKDDVAAQGVKISGDVVSIQHATVHPKLAPKDTGQRIQFTWHFDYSNVTRDELLDLATKTLVISMRGPFKTLDAPKPDEWNGRTFAVREWLDTERRQPVDKVGKTASLFSQMSDAEKADFLRSIGKE